MRIQDGQVSVVVLGITQDAGLPHASCSCPRCEAAFSDLNLTQFSASIAIVDSRQSPSRTWLIDATPDIKYQLNLLRDALGPHPARAKRLRQPDGLFLTHGHMGHTAGLVHLGPEAMAVQGLKLYASVGLLDVLKKTRLWSLLLEELDLIPVIPNEPLEIASRLTITPIPVPHRDEVGGNTFAYQIEGETATLLYLPDIDGWAQWLKQGEKLGILT